MRDLEERVEALELAHRTDRLAHLEVLDKVTKRLEWRERKRVDAQLDLERPAETEDTHALGYARRFGGNGGS